MKRYCSIILLFAVCAATADAQTIGRVCINDRSGQILSYTRRCPTGFSELTQSRLRSLVSDRGPQGQRGAKGERGLNGSKGPTGDKGLPGEGAFDRIPSGKTITGVIGAQQTASTSIPGDIAAWTKTSAIPGVLSSSLSSGEVIVSYNALFTQCNASAPNKDRYNCMNGNDSDPGTNSRCTGSVDNPTAPAGKVCIYTYSLSNAYNVEGRSAANTKAGFEVSWISVPSESPTTDFRAVWAYTAP